MSIYYKANSDGGKTTCKYYKACGNTENCKRCGSYEKSTEAISDIASKINE